VIRKLMGVMGQTTSAFALLIIAAQSTSGCSLRSMELRQVDSQLTVVVTHQGKPIAGIEIQVVPEKGTEAVFTGVTDESGTVLIQGLATGHYNLTASHDGFEAGKEWIDVVDAHKGKPVRHFAFEWAEGSYQVRQVAGSLTGLIPGNTGNKLMDIVHPIQTVYSGVDITLKNAFSEGEYRTVSDSGGAFFFDRVADGIYVLTIAGGMKSISGAADITRHVIDVAHTANRAALPLQLQDSGCYRTEFELNEKESN